ncbi:NUDIX hydrolase [Haematospirillum jordaniae]|uniref:NUDIX hydrolase n=1 Tax=Haematospirillum jordaniae TaxID=1549855 RepID=UPI001432BE72|nr:NUDIX hydrolase [Haematospirillum jordaniae]NKD86171.1 NUDIX hydrolase [Haematospirillum jordaniae]
MSSRYPRSPVPAVLAVVPRGNRVLLVRRRHPPDAGSWGFPGGRLDLGEPLLAAAERELHEETGVRARGIVAFAAFDVIDRDIAGAVRYHYVLNAVYCQWEDGDGVAGDDAAEVAWVRVRDFHTPALIGQGGGTLGEQVPPLARMGWRMARTLRREKPV